MDRRASRQETSRERRYRLRNMKKEAEILKKIKEERAEARRRRRWISGVNRFSPHIVLRTRHPYQGICIRRRYQSYCSWPVSPESSSSSEDSEDSEETDYGMNWDWVYSD